MTLSDRQARAWTDYKHEVGWSLPDESIETVVAKIARAIDVSPTCARDLLEEALVSRGESFADARRLFAERARGIRPR